MLHKVNIKSLSTIPLKGILDTLSLLSPLGEGQSPSFEQFRIPPPNDDLCQVWRRSRKSKSLQTDDGQSE